MNNRALMIILIFAVFMTVSCHEYCCCSDANSPLSKDDIVYHPPVVATCTGHGIRQYWTKKSCPELFFLNNEATEYTTAFEDLTTEALGHDTCVSTYNSDNNCHWLECSRCHEHVNSAPHSFEVVFIADSAARTLMMKSCCSVCDMEYSNRTQSNNGAFDISVSDGITAVRTAPYSNSWILSINKEIANLFSNCDCSWFIAGTEITELRGSEPFMFSCDVKDDGTYFIYCKYSDRKGKIQEVCTVQISR